MSIFESLLTTFELIIIILRQLGSNKNCHITISKLNQVKLVKICETLLFTFESLFAGDRGRRRSKFVLYRRQKANGVAPSQKYHVKSPQNSPAILNTQLHSISYTLSRNQAVIVEYAHDENTDLFQVISSITIKQLLVVFGTPIT